MGLDSSTVLRPVVSFGLSLLVSPTLETRFSIGIAFLTNGIGVGEIARSVGVTERTIYETRWEAARCLLQLLDRAGD